MTMAVSADTHQLTINYLMDNNHISLSYIGILRTTDKEMIFVHLKPHMNGWCFFWFVIKTIKQNHGIRDIKSDLAYIL